MIQKSEYQLTIHKIDVVFAQFYISCGQWTFSFLFLAKLCVLSNFSPKPANFTQLQGDLN